MNTKQLAKVYKALSNENRLKIFLRILNSNDSLESQSSQKECGCQITEVVGKLGIGAPTISHHLKELSNAGLIQTKKEGKFLIAKVNKELVNELRKVLIQK